MERVPPHKRQAGRFTGCDPSPAPPTPPGRLGGREAPSNGRKGGSGGSLADECRRYPAAPDETVVERDRRNAARAGAEAVYADKRDGGGGASGL